MAKELNRRVKAAMDETRLLVLGVQVLLGCEFQCFFQDGFETLSRGSKSISGLGLGLVIASLGLLVVPSMIHQIAEYGRSTARLVRTTNAFAGLGLVPLTAGLGLSAYVVLERHFGLGAGLAGGLGLACLAGFGWFGLELLMGSQTKGLPVQASRTPLSIRIEQLLTEARVIIPGAQAYGRFRQASAERQNRPCGSPLADRGRCHSSHDAGGAASPFICRRRLRFVLPNRFRLCDRVAGVSGRRDCT
jgi:hypothetical protein